MTSFELRPSSARPISRPARSGARVQRALLACGILSSLLYAATDLLGGLRYEGYSFTSQAVSELMASGGRRFRLCSAATFLTMIALGVLSAPNGARLAAGLPTPGFGIVERINIYASLLWIAVLAVALLRRPIVRDVRILP